jgi:hypothetical protein
MLKFLKLAVITIIASLGVSSTTQAQTTKYKCMIQMTNYMGEGAYMVVSIVDAKGAYDKTLYVLGSDKKWYKDLKEWHKAFSKNLVT